MSGRVQGVGFRWWTRLQAERLNLSGAVRNRPDGKVEVRVRGPRAAIEEMHRLLNEGPPTADVDSVTSIDAPEVESEGFQIQH